MRYLSPKYQLNLLVSLILISNVIYPQWNIQYNQSYDLLDCVHFVNYNNGWAVGGRGGVGALILKTTDGGTNWYDNLIIPNTVNTFNSIYFIDQNTGWVVGFGGIMMKTTNAGTSWDTVTIPTNGALRQIQFIDSNYGWAVGLEETGGNPRGIILRTTDSGMNWERIDMGLGNFFNSFCFVNQNLGWGVGSGIQKTIDGGLNWVTQKDTTGRSIFFTDELNGWSVGAEEVGPWGFIHKTTDGGDTWSRFSSLDIPSLMSVNFFDKNIGWAVGVSSSSPIIKTTDGGNSWFHQESGAVISLSSVFIIDSVTGWTVGFGGVFIGYILKTTNGGVTFVEEKDIDEIPTNFYIGNNYPNPFNPSTKITYSIPQSLNIVIKVFDVLGNEIETLVNEEKPKGIYEITWYAERLPSGVYFYRLQAGNFVETKKMILMK